MRLTLKLIETLFSLISNTAKVGRKSPNIGSSLKNCKGDCPDSVSSVSTDREDSKDRWSVLATDTQQSRGRWSVSATDTQQSRGRWYTSATGGATTDSLLPDDLRPVKLAFFILVHHHPQAVVSVINHKCTCTYCTTPAPALYQTVAALIQVLTGAATASVV